MSVREHTLEADARRLETALSARARELRAAADGGDANVGSLLTPVGWARVEQAVKRMAARALGPNGLGDLLDVGTGSGRMLRVLAADASSAEGLDRSDEMRLAARTALREAGLDNCIVREGDMYRLPYDDGRFDTVVFGHVLTCADEPRKAVREAVRVLKVRGHLLVMELLADGVPVDAWCGSLVDWLSSAGVDVLAQERISLPGATAVLCLNQREPPVESRVEFAIA
jgi:ubiquinone/menaquinone biosynthesis C-methylase UbiE